MARPRRTLSWRIELNCLLKFGVNSSPDSRSIFLVLGLHREISSKETYFTKEELRTGANFSIVFASAIAWSCMHLISDLMRLIVGFLTLTWVAHMKNLPAVKAMERMMGSPMSNISATFFFSRTSSNTFSISGTRTLIMPRTSSASISETWLMPWNGMRRRVGVREMVTISNSFVRHHSPWYPSGTCQDYVLQ